MRAVDTNVLVRLLARDDPKQLKAAEAFVLGGAWVSHVVLVETAWVLTSVYSVAPDKLAEAIQMLLAHRLLVIQEPETVAGALAQLRKRPSVGFSDCLVLELARKSGHVPLGTFDAGLAKLEDVQKL